MWHTLLLRSELLLSIIKLWLDVFWICCLCFRLCQCWFSCLTAMHSFHSERRRESTSNRRQGCWENSLEIYLSSAYIHLNLTYLSCPGTLCTTFGDQWYILGRGEGHLNCPYFALLVWSTDDRFPFDRNSDVYATHSTQRGTVRPLIHVVASSLLNRAKKWANHSRFSSF